MVISFLVLRVSGRQSAECRQVFEVIARIAQTDAKSNYGASAHEFHHAQSQRQASRSTRCRITAAPVDVDHSLADTGYRIRKAGSMVVKGYILLCFG